MKYYGGNFVKKKDIIKFSISVVLVIFIIIMEAMLLPALISSSLINKNTAAYMIFDVEMSEKWNERTEYTWIDPDTSYKDSINQEWSSAFGDIFIEGYTADYYVAVVSELLAAQTSLDVDAIYDKLQTSSFGTYSNEFIKMQAGYLVGDNIPPTPSTEKLRETLDVAIKNVDDEELNTWYEQHNVELTASLKDAMVDSNELFSASMLEENPIFGESCLTLKILNLLLLFYSALAIIVILGFCVIKVCKTKFTWPMLAISQFLSACICLSTYLSLKNINFVVFGIPYAPTDIMIRDSMPMFLILLACELLAGALFIFLWKFGKKFKSRVISKKNA